MSISERQKEILELIEKGYSNEQIGESLSISINTVKFHLNKIYRELDVSNRTQALVAFYQLTHRNEQMRNQLK